MFSLNESPVSYTHLLFISVKSIILPLQKPNIIAMAKIVFKELTSNQNVHFGWMLTL